MLKLTIKSKIYNKSQIILIYINILNFSIGYTNTEINKQIIQIQSTYQSINMLTHTIIFTENVRIHYNELKLYANKVLISYTNNQNNLSAITAYGNPLILLYYSNELKKKINAQSSTLYYNFHDNTISFTGNAYIKQPGVSIHGDNIVYKIKKKQIEITANLGNQVTTKLTNNK